MNAVNFPQKVFTLLFPFVFLYLEIVFALSTGTDLMSGPAIYILLFSFCYGLIFYLITTLFPKPGINRFLKGLFLLAIGLVYTVVYFIYMEFRVFYDINTMFGGAGGAVTEFSDLITKLVISPNGIGHIILYFLPFALYALIFRRFDEAASAHYQNRINAVMGSVLCYLVSILCLNSDSVTKLSYDKEYNFDAAIRHFGLASGVRLEVKNLLIPGSEDNSFETVANPYLALATPTPTPVPAITVVTEDSGETAPTPTPTPIVYGDNILDIDFEALAETAKGDLKTLDEYVASIPASSQTEYTGMFKGKNLILMTAEAFTAEVIDPDLTPTLYRLANKGIQFTDFYQPASAGTTGGEYAVLMGMLPTSGGMSMKSTAKSLNYMTMGYQLNMQGYRGKAFHNNSYTYYSRDLTHVNLGYSDGYAGYGNGLEDYITSQWPQSDLEMFAATLPEYLDKQPFNLYYMTVSGHSLYSQGSNAMSKKHWDEVADLEYSNTVKAYIACQLELEAGLTYIVNTLEEAGIADDTVIVICADHFPYGLDSDSSSGYYPYLSELYGEPISSTLYRDHNRLIIWSGCLEDEDPIIVDSPTFSPDITPTLLNLFGIEFDSRLLPGRDVLSDAMPLVFDLGYDWKTDLGTYISSKGTFTPVSEDIEIPEDYVANVKAIVRNKITYCKLALNNDYFRHVFGDTITPSPTPTDTPTPTPTDTPTPEPTATATPTQAANAE